MTDRDRSLRPIRHLLWDWNGTLLDDVDLCVEVISALRAENGQGAIDATSYRELFGFPVIDYYRKLGFDTAPESFARLSDQFIARYYTGFFRQSRVHRGAVAFATEWKREGRRQAILSASRQDHLESAVRHHALTDLFERLGGISDIYARGKIEAGRALLTHLDWDPAETLLIGDTDHDAAVAHALGVPCLLVAHGHQSRERLLGTGCPVVDDLAEARSRFGLGAEVSLPLPSPPAV